MELGMIGLGRMGANMTLRLLRGGHRVVGFDFNSEARQRVEQHGAESAASFDALVQKLKPPRTLWMMVPAGNATEETVAALLDLLQAGATIVDGGNSNYKNTQLRAQRCGQKQLNYLDCGTSGGIWGLTEGYSMMIGGEAATVAQLRPIFEHWRPHRIKAGGTLAPAVRDTSPR